MTVRLLALFSAAAMLACAETDAGKRLQAAAQAFKEVMDVPDKTIPQDLLNKAHCIVIIPGLKTGAFIVGGKYGKGFVACRKNDGVGWTAPASVRVEGGSFGFQIGGTSTDLFMLVMNDSGMNRLLSTKFTLGGDASAAAGPVGREAQAQTDAAMTAEILTWSRAKGLFAGISLQGATLRPDEDWNKELYGRDVTNREILTGSIAPPAAAAALEANLNKYSSRK
ncbi:MAG TPA: lipid-binding SYLF domain-containing protein [Bryobacteraceae bacterium]|jgi:lipid-binding SYLF domain-containing protein|nr:lipid-binding SYLF domain-containing protein [Bryobacteraceae bacterium]